MKKLNLISLGTAVALLFGGDVAFAKNYDSGGKSVSTRSQKADKNKIKRSKSASVKKEKTDSDRWMEAAKKGDLSTLTSLLKEKKVDVNYDSTKYGNTALKSVITSKDIKDEKERVKIVKFLLEKGADPNIGKYSSPLKVAASNGREEIVELLIKHKAKVTGDALISASLNGNVNIIRSLVEHGADVNYKETFGYFPLMEAAERGHFDAVKYLVEHGAKINEQPKYGVSSLASAASGGYADIVKYLIEKGADVNLQDKYKYTALRNAIRSKVSEKNTIESKLRIINALLKSKADPNVIDSEGHTPLSWAQAQRRLAKDSESRSTWNDVIQKLKDAGAKE